MCSCGLSFAAEDFPQFPQDLCVRSFPPVALKGSNKITDKFQDLCESTVPSMIVLEGLGNNLMTNCWTLAVQVYGQMLHPVKVSANWEDDSR